jgi:hypothetical protein
MVRKDDVLPIRMQKIEKELIKEEAKKNNQTPSEYARTLLLNSVFSINLNNTANESLIETLLKRIKFLEQEIKDNTNINIKSYTILTKLAEQNMSKEEVMKLLDDANKWLENKNKKEE